MAYATLEDLRERMMQDLSGEQALACQTMLDDVAVMIDAYAPEASAEAKRIVSCRVVIRTIGGGPDIPLGATQGSMSAMGYSQSWTIGSGSYGEGYLTKTERRILGLGDKIGTYSPVEELVPDKTGW